MGAGASTTLSDAEKVKAYDKLAAKYSELVAAGLDESKVQEILNAPAAEAAAAPAEAATPSDSGSRRESTSSSSGARRESVSSMEMISADSMFASFCAMYRSDGMTNTIWAKFCNDSKLVDKKFPKPSIDMVWSKCAGKEKKVDCNTFVRMLEEVAKIKGIDGEKFVKHLRKHATVKNSGTKGESRFYDDKNTWTGVATKGGPTSIDKKTDLSDLADRDNKADVRGVIQA